MYNHKGVSRWTTVEQRYEIVGTTRVDVEDTVDGNNHDYGRYRHRVVV